MGVSIEWRDRAGGRGGEKEELRNRERERERERERGMKNEWHVLLSLSSPDLASSQLLLSRVADGGRGGGNQ